MSEREPQGPEKILKIDVTLSGVSRSAALVARVLDEEERMGRDRAVVQLAGAVSFDELPIASRLRVWALATVRAGVRDRPLWFDEWIGKHDQLLFAVFEEVERLERDYFRGYVGAGEENESEPTFQITTTTPPRSPSAVP